VNSDITDYDYLSKVVSPEDSFEKSIVKYQHIDLSSGHSSTLANEATLEVFPNPASNGITVLWNASKSDASLNVLTGVYTITNQLGEVVYETACTSGFPLLVNVDAKKLSNATYYIRIQPNSETQRVSPLTKMLTVMH
jgi:hypothetical protein